MKLCLSSYHLYYRVVAIRLAKARIGAPLKGPRHVVLCTERVVAFCSRAQVLGLCIEFVGLLLFCAPDIGKTNPRCLSGADGVPMEVSGVAIDLTFLLEW